MRTSLDIPDHLMAMAREKAAQDGTSLREVMLAALSSHLLHDTREQPVESGQPFRFPVLTGSGGFLPGIDPTDSSALLEIE